MSAWKGTPGPWIADNFCEESGRETRVGTYDGSAAYYHRTATIAFVLTNHDDEDAPDDAPRIGIVEAERNAKGIAAVPQLVEALLALRETLNRNGFATEQADEALAAAGVQP